MTTHIYLARHGETQWNKEQKFQGQLDSELTEKGKVQVKEMALQLLGCNIDLIISSSLNRAINSAKICQSTLNSPIEISNNLIERNLGDWQGGHAINIKKHSDYNEILQQFTALKPRNGESAIDCAERVYQVIKNLAIVHKNKRILIIFHGEALRCFLAKLGNHSTGNAYDLFTNGCIFELCYTHSNEKFQLITGAKNDVN